MWYDALCLMGFYHTIQSTQNVSLMRGQRTESCDVQKDISAQSSLEMDELQQRPNCLEILSQ